MVGLARGSSIPNSDALVLLSLVTVFAGVMAYSIIVATIVNAKNVRDSNAVYQERVEDIASFVSYTHMPADAADELFGFYRHMFISLGTTDLNYNPLHDLPQELAIKIQVQQATELLSQTLVFECVSSNVSFLTEIHARMYPRVLMPGEWLVRTGELANFMCVVTHGELRVLMNEAETGGT